MKRIKKLDGQHARKVKSAWHMEQERVLGGLFDAIPHRVVNVGLVGHSRLLQESLEEIDRLRALRLSYMRLAQYGMTVARITKRISDLEHQIQIHTASPGHGSLVRKPLTESEVKTMLDELESLKQKLDT